MKKYLWLLFLLPSLCFGATGDLQTIGGKVDTAITSIAGKAGTAIATISGKNYTDGDGGLTCTHGSGDSAILSQDTGTSDSTVSDSSWRSQEITFSVATRITEFILQCYDNGGTGNMVVSLRANSSNLPTGADIAGTTVTESSDNIGGTTEAHHFVLSSPVDVEAGTYHIVVRGSGTTPYFYWQYATDDPYASNSSGYSYDGTSWTENTGGDAGVDRRFIVTGCQCGTPATYFVLLPSSTDYVLLPSSTDKVKLPGH
jgi:hypothetical protein